MDARTIATYDRMAEEYDAETAGFWDAFPSAVFDRFVASWPRTRDYLNFVALKR